MAQAAIKSVETPLTAVPLRFGTDGIRGHAESFLNSKRCLEIGFCIGKVLSGSGPVLIGRDSRCSGEAMSYALTAGLNAAGKEVWDLGLCPTPTIATLIKESGAIGGLMVSASHNPPEDNGIKVFGPNGSKLKSSDQRIIESYLEEDLTGKISQKTTNNNSNVTKHPELLTKYQRKLEASTKGQRLDGVSIVLDLCWGSATAISAEVFTNLGAQVTVLHGQPDGKRINVKCGSTNLLPLRKAVLETNAEMGFAFDGDADRMLAIDSKGRVIDGDHILYLWGSALREQNALPEQRLIATVMSNLGFEKAWEDSGGLLERTAVGDQYVHTAMLSSGAALGGEQSGHILSSEHQFAGDGLFTAIQLSTLCKSKGLTLTQWLDQSFTPFPQKLVNIHVPNKSIRRGWSNCQPLNEAILNAKEAMGNEGRVIVRASGTQPLIRVMVEASDSGLVDSFSSKIACLAEQHLNAA
ncbi:phosphoglucosamine mutase [Prochlorococcus sp. MIT 1300]|uniref:phosphoglucosamine mutase n=1 Tax=Prochlorococcus sp. MIT 1300 TaxID=3096218 RepID=UPI002A749042|nr:phosphoglucosamine mutase [Prochlorococcus sp. MIT 1300]